MRRVLFCIVICCLAALSLFAQQQVVVSGTVRDASSHRKIDNVSIFVQGTTIGTVTNADGYFSIKVPAQEAPFSIKAECLGYRSVTVSAQELEKSRGELVISLTPSSRLLKEAVVRSGEPREIVEDAFRSIQYNYSSGKNLFSAFYRETVQKGDRYIGVSEAVVDVIKTPYTRQTTAGERVRIVKGRKVISQSMKDTLSVKIVGGPTLPVMLDFVKNEDFLMSLEGMDAFDFSMEKQTSIDDRLQYVIRFEPRLELEYALCRGLFYIDQESLTFTRAEFELDMSDVEKATKVILRSKPRGLRFRPQEMSYVVTYKRDGERSYINYVSSKTRFRCDWKRRLFKSNYTTEAEVVMVHRDDRPLEDFSRKTAFREDDIFYDKVENYWDSDYWKDYNIIEPTESLDKAVGRLRKRNQREER